MKRTPPTHLTLGASLALALSLGCRDEKPYTPFGVASALPPRAAPSASAAASQTPPTQPVIERKAVLAPAGAQKYQVAGRELESPPGRVFQQLLSADLDENGSIEIAAWTTPAPNSEAQSPGELWLYTGEAPKKLLEFPAFVPTDEGCKHTIGLSQSGVHLIAVDVQASCDKPRLARTPTRAIALVDPRSETPSAPRFGLRVADAAPGEQLTVKLGAGDEDADGRDDFRLEVALSRPGIDLPAEAVFARFLWLDRAAGVSRDTREPARGLEGILSRELTRAKQKKTAQAATVRVELTRRLLGAICAEGQVPRLFDWDGAPLHCAPFGSVIDKAASAELTAALTLGDPALALITLLRDGWYFGSMGQKQKDALTKDVEKQLTRVPAARITLGARPKPHTPPAYSPLSFEPDGSLLLQAEGGLFRFAPDAAREELVDPSSGLSAWPLDVRNASGAPFIAVNYSCDRSEVSLLVAAPTSPTENTDLLAPRPGVCTGRPFVERVASAPISSDRGLRLLVAGSEIGGPMGTIPRGSARSRDGRYLAVATPLGLLVRGAASELWQIDGWNGAHGCVVANDGRRAACIRAGKAELYLKAEPTAVQ